MAKLQRIQTGEITFPAVSSPQTITVSSYTLANSFVYWISRGGTASDPDFNSMRMEKTNTTTLTMFRTNTGSTNSHTLIWYLLEFDTDVVVQDVIVTGQGNQGTTISAVTLANSWAFSLGVTLAGSIWSGDDMLALDFTNTTTLRNQNSGSVANTRSIQVVDFGADASVQSITETNLTGTSTTSTISSVPMNKTQVWPNGYNVGASPAQVNPEDIWRVELASATTLGYDRVSSAHTGMNPITEVGAFIVTINNTKVQRGTRNFSSSQTNETVTVDPVRLANTTARFLSSPHSQQNGLTSADTDDDHSTSTFTGEMDDKTTFRVQRAATGSLAADANWELTDWGLPALVFKNPFHRTSLIGR